MTDGGWSPEREAALEDLERRLGHAFADRDLLVAALTHRSFSHEAHPPCRDNESLEFLGDAVIAFDICDRLFERFPGLDEGRLSKHKHLLVRASTLADCARDLRLGLHVRLGRGERKNGEPNERILANVFEAIVAAVHIDGGLEAARRLLASVFEVRLDALDATNPVTDWKSLLQEAAQSRSLGTPVYRTVDEIGPDHRRTFHVVVNVGDHELGSGSGTTKRAAHQMAARKALEHLRARGADGVSS